MPTAETGFGPTDQNHTTPPQSPSFPEQIMKLCQDFVTIAEEVSADQYLAGVQALHHFAKHMAAKRRISLQDDDESAQKRPKFRTWSIPSATPQSHSDSERASSESERVSSKPVQSENQELHHAGKVQERSSTQSVKEGWSTSDKATADIQSVEFTPQELLEARLEKMLLPLTEQIGTRALTQMRNSFCNRIQQLQMTVVRDNKQVQTTFSPDEVVEITNFFFSDMLGPKALRRLSDLVDYYSGGLLDVMDKGLAQRAYHLAQAQETPDILRGFFGAVSRVSEQDPDENKMFKHVQQVLRHLEFMKEYNRLKGLAQQKNADLVEVLKQQGQTTRKGVSLVTCLFNVLTASLNLSRVGLSNIVQSITGIEKLVETFGHGIILLLPPGAAHRLSRWGNQRMAYVYPILDNELDGLSDVCNFIDLHVLDRIRLGEAIPLTQIKTGTKISLQERIQEAIEEKDEELAIYEVSSE